MLRNSLFFLLFIFCHNLYGQTLFDVLKDVSKPMLIRTYGDADANTFKFIDFILNDSALRDAFIFFEGLDNYVVKSYFHQNNRKDEFIKTNEKCLYLSDYEPVKTVSFYGLGMTSFYPYLKIYNSKGLDKLENDFKVVFNLPLEQTYQSIMRYELVDTIKKQWIFKNVLEPLKADKMDSLLLAFNLTWTNYFDFDVQVATLKKQILGGPMIFVSDYDWACGSAYPNRRNAFRFCSNKVIEANSDLTVINFIVGNAIYTPNPIDGRNEIIEFKNNLTGNFKDFEIVPYESLSKKVYIFDNMWVDKKYFKNDINIYIDSVDFCKYKWGYNKFLR